MKKLKNWTIYEIIWLFLFSLIAIVLTLMWQDTLFGFSVFITGVLCVVLAAKGNIFTYIFGMYNTLGYAYLAYNNGLYGELGLNMLFFVPMNIVGFIMWRRYVENGKLRMLQMKKSNFILLVFACGLTILGLGFGLSFIPGQNSPYIDATTNVLSVVATILMVKRYKEQWLLYIVLNFFTIIMWTLRTVNGSSDGPMMIVMWSAYLINAIYGFTVWHKGAQEAKRELA